MISLFFRFKLQPESIKCFPPLPVQGSGEEKKLLTKLSTLADLHDILTCQIRERLPDNSDPHLAGHRDHVGAGVLALDLQPPASLHQLLLHLLHTCKPWLTMFDDVEQYSESNVKHCN